MNKFICLGAAFLLTMPAIGAATVTDLKDWTLEGAVALDPGKPGPDGAPSIKLEPKSRALLKLRPADGAGKLTLFIYDDGAVASPQGQKAAGPRWGFTQANGRVFVGGLMYAKFLQPEGSLCVMDANPRDKGAWLAMNFVAARGKPGWRKWVFEYDADAGLKIAIDDKPVTSRQFDWNKSQAAGFDGLALYGDATTAGTPQTVWVGGLAWELGGPMKAAPAGATAATVPGTATPAPAVVTLDAPRPSWVAAARQLPGTPAPFPGPTLTDDLRNPLPPLLPNQADAHPRLLFSTTDRAALQAKAAACPQLWNAVLGSAKGLQSPPPPEQVRNGWKYWRVTGVDSAALAWFLTDDAAAREKAVQWLTAYCREPVWGTAFRPNLDLEASWFLYHLSFAYDVLYPTLSEDDRRLIRDGLAGHAKYIYDHFNPDVAKDKFRYDQNHTYTPAVALAAAALVLLDDVPEARDWLDCARAVMNRCRYVLNEDGYYYEGYGYWQYALHWHVRYADLMARATGESLHGLPALRDNWLFALHLSLPGAPGAFDVGDTAAWKEANRRPDAGVANTSILWGLARANRSPESRAAGDLYAARRLDTDDPAAAFLWFAPDVTPAELAKLPPYHRFADQDVVAWRSGWGGDDTCVLFRCGPPLGHTAMAKTKQLQDWEMNTGHVHADIGAFLLYAKGAYLAVDTGYTTEKWTRDHNTLLVDGKGQAIDGDYHHDRRFPYEKQDQVRIDACHLEDAYGFAAGDMGSVYAGTPGVRLRRIVLMTARWLLVVDDMSGEKEHRPTWLCHADAEFRAEGAAHVARLEKAALAVFSLSGIPETATLGPTIVMSGTAPGKGKPEQHGWQLSLSPATAAAQTRLIHLIVPLAAGEPLPAVKLEKMDGDRLDLRLQWAGGKTEQAEVDLTWKNGPAGPARITPPQP